MNLQELENIAAKCELCNLYKGRNKAVFAKGNPEANMMICGMCPGPDENRMGSPFVGKAGEILDALIYNAFGTRDYSNVYITNLVKCFVPPGQKLEEVWMCNCLPYFMIQLGIVNPRTIITLGKDVSNFLLDSTDSVGSMRNRTHRYAGSKIIVTYHPSYLARGGGVNHKDFGKVVQDFQKAGVE